MRIQDAYRAPVDFSPKPAATRSSSGATDANESPGADSVKVSVSDKARELARASSHDESRISALKQSIENGTFKIDSRAIASKMLGDRDGDGDA